MRGWLSSQAGKTALLLQKTEERVGIVAVDLDLLETGEVGAVGEFAEIVDRLIGAGGLLAKLVAGEIEDFKALGVIFLIEGFEFLILRSKATLVVAVFTMRSTSLAYSRSDTSLPFLSLTAKSKTVFILFTINISYMATKLLISHETEKA